MNPYGNPLTPGTCMGSDDGMSVSSKAVQRRRGWGVRSRRKQPQLTSHRALYPSTSASKFNAKSAGTSSSRSSSRRSVSSGSLKKGSKNSNVIKRAIHKIAKKTRRRHSFHSTEDLKPSPAAAMAPPKIEDLGIDPRLLEKWKSRKELKKQGSVVVGEKPDSRRTAKLVVAGLSSGSLAWTKDRLRSWSRANGVVLAACIVAAAVAVACALILRRCS